MLLHIKDKDSPAKEITLEEVKFQYRNKILSGSTLYWRAGMKEWARLDQLPELNAETHQSPKEERLGENWLYRQIDARRTLGDSEKHSKPTTKQMWLKALSLTGVVLTYIFACLLFISFVVTRDQNHNPLLGFLLGLILFRRISRIQSESVIINKQNINFFAYYFKASFLACLKWLLYLTPVYIFAIVDAETASDFGKNIGKIFGLYICTIVLAVDAPLWPWRKRNQFTESGYPQKNLVWAFVGGIGIPLSIIYLFTIFIPAFQNSIQRAQIVAEASKLPKPRSISASKPEPSPSDEENKSLEKNEDQLTEEEIDLLKIKAHQGNADAQANLAICYLKGAGVAKNKAKAVEWFRKSAEQGNAEGQAGLAISYLYASDFPEAVKWFRKASEQGNIRGLIGMGFCYANGEGVVQDEVEAYAYFNLVYLRGIRLKEADDTRIKIEQKLSKEELSIGNRRAKEILENINKTK